MKILKASQSVNQTVLALKRGEVIIFPTDTVYGFLADASNKKAVADIFKIKKRPKSKPLSVFVSNVPMAKKIANVDVATEKLLKKYWPGKQTFILKRTNVIIYGVKKDSVALRVPNYKTLQHVLKKFNKPISQTSVNSSGEKPLNDLKGILREFGYNKNIGLIVDGGTIKKAKPSKIIDMSGKKVTVLRR